MFFQEWYNQHRCLKALSQSGPCSPVDQLLEGYLEAIGFLQLCRSQAGRGSDPQLVGSRRHWGLGGNRACKGGDGRATLDGYSVSVSAQQLSQRPDLGMKHIADITIKNKPCIFNEFTACGFLRWCSAAAQLLPSLSPYFYEMGMCFCTGNLILELGLLLWSS